MAYFLEIRALFVFTGCGKSTITHLVERFYDIDDETVGCVDIERGVQKSGIKLDGVDLRDLNVKWLRSQIGLGMKSYINSN